MLGDDGDDTIYGGAGDDLGLVGGKGEDLLYGGDSDDVIGAEGDGQRDRTCCGEGRDRCRADEVDRVSDSCEVKMKSPKSKGIP